MNKLKSLLFEENVYTIAIRERKDTLLFENGGKTEKFFTLPITDQSWYADPMVFTYKGKDWLFCEIYDREKDLGTIGVTELTSLHIKPPREVLNIGTHLSYPCVFELDGEIYMIPETTTRKNIVVFHASHFPDRWEQVNELMHGGEWADTTVYATSNITLVLTFEQCQGDGSITKVHVHDGRELPARLIEYPSVKFEYDKQNRGAGNFFEYDNMLIRPSQNCTLDYGHALRFNKVLDS